MSEFFVTKLAAYTAPEVVELKNKDWVQYGIDNNYFNYIIDVNNNSTTCRAITIGVSNMIYGKGLAAHDGDKRPEQYAQMMSLFKKSDLRRFINDYKVLGMAAFQLVYQDGRVKEVHHFPMETLRAEKCNDDGEIEAWYYSNHWDNLKPTEQPERIPAFGYGKDNGVEMYVLKPYEAGKYYYSSPDWSSAMPYAVLEDEIGDYLINDCINGFSGTKVVNFNNGVPDPDKMQSIKSDVLGKLTGSRGEKVIVAFNNNAESKTTIDDIPLNDAPAHYQYLADECFKKLIVGHRVTSPMLLGIREGNDGMGNNAEEIKTATQLFDNIVIQCFQDQVIDCIDAILSVNDIALDLYFKTLKPLDFTDIDIVNEEIIEEETGYEMSLKKIDGIEAYKTIEEAEAKALEQGCKGHHEHEMDGEVFYMPCESHEKASLSEKESKEILGSLAESGVEMSNDYVYVDEIDDDSDIDNEDWANYLIKEKKSTLSKVKGLLGLKDEIDSKKNGSSFSYLDSKNGLYKIRYTYARGSYKPSLSQRDFCRNMINMANAGIVWTIEDIDRASREGVNRELGHNGQSYDLFKFKGGIYCRHKWRKVLYRLESNTEPSDNLGNYKKTKTIPKSYMKNPTGSKQSGIAPENMPNRGAYPG
tara:strand:+ start:2326 stop:4251 length:1926 start_codon:yes stop_codon:yes gene_type:complete